MIRVGQERFVMAWAGQLYWDDWTCDCTRCKRALRNLIKHVRAR